MFAATAVIGSHSGTDCTNIVSDGAANSLSLSRTLYHDLALQYSMPLIFSCSKLRLSL